LGKFKLKAAKCAPFIIAYTHNIPKIF